MTSITKQKLPTFNLNREELIEKAPNKNDIRAMLRNAADVQEAAHQDVQGNDRDAARQEVQIGAQRQPRQDIQGNHRDAARQEVKKELQSFI